MLSHRMRAKCGIFIDSTCRVTTAVCRKSPQARRVVSHAFYPPLATLSLCAFLLHLRALKTIFKYEYNFLVVACAHGEMKTLLALRRRFREDDADKMLPPPAAALPRVKLDTHPGLAVWSGGVGGFMGFLVLPSPPPTNLCVFICPLSTRGLCVWCIVTPANVLRTVYTFPTFVWHAFTLKFVSMELSVKMRQLFQASAFVRFAYSSI